MCVWLITQPGHLARLERIDSADDLELAVGDEFRKDGSGGTELLDHHLDIITDGIRNRITRHAAALIDGGLDETYQRGDVTFSLTALDSRGYGAAAFMAQYDQ